MPRTSPRSSYPISQADRDILAQHTADAIRGRVLTLREISDENNRAMAAGKEPNFPRWPEPPAAGDFDGDGDGDTAA